MLYLGCTKARAAAIGIEAAVNARGGRQDLNDLTQEDIEMYRDALSIKAVVARRVRWYGPVSRFFRRNRARVEHLISSSND